MTRTGDLTFDLEQAHTFLRVLTGTGDPEVTFQTFPDRRDGAGAGAGLTRILNGSLSDHAVMLSSLNRGGAGVFVVVNQTDLRGRKRENVEAVRAVWLDIDDVTRVPLQLATLVSPRPHIVVESSPGLAHLYWRVSDCSLEEFASVQEALAREFGGDPKIKDLPRVMRLPGFFHNKQDPVLVRIASIDNAPTYSIATIRSRLLRHPDAEAPRGLHASSGGAGLPTPQTRLSPSEALSGADLGSRDDSIFRLACRLRAQCFEIEEARELVLAAAANSRPPFPESEALLKLKQAWKYPEGMSVETLTDVGNGKRFVRQHGAEVRWIPEFSKWILWTKGCWTIDLLDDVMALAKLTSSTIYREAASVTDSAQAKAIAAHAGKSQQLQRLRAMLELSKTETLMSMSQAGLDADPWLLGVQNGVVDLRTGSLESAIPEQFITKRASVPYDADAQCPQWTGFLHTVMGGDASLISFLQRAVGYSLSGGTGEQCLFFLYGTGRNGKSTFLGVLKDLLGEYAAQCAPDTLMVKGGDGGASNDIARLRGARFVSTIEAEDGKRFAESLVKQLTGGDPIVARFLFQEHFEFRPQFKIWLAANHKPIIRGDDLAIWRRIRLIPFDVTVKDADVDRDLPEKLAAERPGILRWAIEGCLAWQRDGLSAPAKVMEATEIYRSEMDVFGAWLSECCIQEATRVGSARVLYESYRSWCVQVGGHPLGQVKFSLKLVERGFSKRRMSHGIFYAGVESA